MLPQLFSSALESALNSYLGNDSRSGKRLKPMLNKRLALQLNELPFMLQIQFCETQLVVLATDEGEPDASVQMSALDLPQLADGAALTGLIKQERLALHGEAELLQQFARLLKQTDLDMEELLSRYLGDIPAHRLGKAAGKGRAYLQRQSQEGQANLFEYLTDELGLLPHPRMLKSFRRDVKALSDDVEAVSQRLRALSTRLQDDQAKQGES